MCKFCHRDNVPLPEVSLLVNASVGTSDSKITVIQHTLPTRYSFILVYGLSVVGIKYPLGCPDIIFQESLALRMRLWSFTGPLCDWLFLVFIINYLKWKETCESGSHHLTHGKIRPPHCTVKREWICSEILLQSAVK